MSHRGLFLSLGAAFFGALFLIPYQAAIERADRRAVIAAMLLSAAVFNTIVPMSFRRWRSSVDRVAVLSSLFLAFTTVVGIVAIGASLSVIGAGMTSVVLKLQVVLTSLIGWVAVGERITKATVAGIVLGSGGFLVMTIGWEPAAPVEVPWWALLAALTYAVMQVGTRKVIHRIRPMQVNMMRLWLAAGAVIALTISTGRAELTTLDLETWLLAGAAGLIGPGLSRLCLMFAVRHVTAGFTALVGLVGPVVAIVLGFVVFGEIPGPEEILGAGFILTGVALPVFRDDRV